MIQLRSFSSIIIAFSVLSLTACASNSQKNFQSKAQTSQLRHVDENGVILLPEQREERLRDRLADGAVQGTVLAAKGTVIAAKGAVIVTAEGAEMAAKGAVVGARIGGTASGVRNSVDFVTNAPAAKDAASPVGNKNFTDAALSPLSDFNIRKRERPEILMRLEDEDPYQLEANANCEWYDVRIEELDDVLGDDYDVEQKKSSTLKKVGKNGRGAAISGVASAAGSAIPGRGIIRALSGAKARQKKTRKIYQKGVARRSFLKGVAMSKGCAGY